MGKKSDRLVFDEGPTFFLGSNEFIHVSTILQSGETPLIEVGQFETAGYTSRISIYHPDGTYLAKAVGSQLYSTPEGDKAGVMMRHPGLLTVCEMDGRTLFEMRREEAAALRTTAELYAPDGFFVKASEDEVSGVMISQGSSRGFLVGNAVFTFSDFVFEDCEIGLHYVDRDRIVVGDGGHFTQRPSGPPAPRRILGYPTVAVGMLPEDRSRGKRGSNLQIVYEQPPGPDATIMAPFNDMVASLDALLTQIEEKRGAFATATLFDIDRATGAGSLAVASDWVEKDQRSAVIYVKQFLDGCLSRQESSFIRGVGAVSLNDPAVIGTRRAYGSESTEYPIRVFGDRGTTSPDGFHHIHFRHAPLS